MRHKFGSIVRVVSRSVILNWVPDSAKSLEVERSAGMWY